MTTQDEKYIKLSEVLDAINVQTPEVYSAQAIEEAKDCVLALKTYECPDEWRKAYYDVVHALGIGPSLLTPHEVHEAVVIPRIKAMMDVPLKLRAFLVGGPNVDDLR